MKKMAWNSFPPKRCRDFAGFFIPFILLLCPAGIATAQTNGITENEIILGQSCALKGPTSALGVSMRRGALAYFKHINSQGGIHGKNIRLITYDDGYEPEACAANTRKLIDEDKVFLLFGYVGTPTSKAVVPLVLQKEIPYFAPLTGAQFLRNPLNRQIFNIRASYYQETEAMVKHLLRDRGIDRISVFYQDDSYGRAGLEGVRRAMAKRGKPILNEASYKRNTLDVEPAAKAFLLVNPDAVIMIGAYAPCAEFIKIMREKESDALFLNLSFVGADSLGENLANEGLGVVVTQVVPFPTRKKIPVVAEFNRMLGEYMPDSEPGFVAMEGFLAAKALCHILLMTPEPLTREGFIESAEKQSDIDLGGFSFSFSPEDHQGSDLVYFTQIGPGGFIMPIGNLNHIYQYVK